MNKIDYVLLKSRADEMINLLEYDSMRSAGKMKMNSQHLHSLYYLSDKYEEKMPKKAPAKKEG